ncbi:hypothetical protein V6N13_132643 [Hibiscus sabdariffa]|uniref:Uncharacterized protein n=1 Tax=Hibiscus sabdariffa TaxID=183260 RepID=A0ABR2PWD1_9ROSI
MVQSNAKTPNAVKRNLCLSTTVEQLPKSSFGNCFLVDADLRSGDDTSPSRTILESPQPMLPEIMQGVALISGANKRLRSPINQVCVRSCNSRTPINQVCRREPHIGKGRYNRNENRNASGAFLAKILRKGN